MCGRLQMIAPGASMWCLVLPNTEMGVVSEAKLGRSIATGRRGYSTLAKWVSCVASGEPHEVQANKVLATHGLRVGQAQSSRTIAAVGAVSKIVHGQKNTPATGAEQLDKVITIILAHLAGPRPVVQHVTLRRSSDRGVGPDRVP